MALANIDMESGGKSQPLTHAALRTLRSLNMVPWTTFRVRSALGYNCMAHIHLERKCRVHPARSCLHKLMCNIRLDHMSTQDVWILYHAIILFFDRDYLVSTCGMKRHAPTLGQEVTRLGIHRKHISIHHAILYSHLKLS
jgi:hypothetical protein